MHPHVQLVLQNPVGPRDLLVRLVPWELSRPCTPQMASTARAARRVLRTMHDRKTRETRWELTMVHALFLV